MSYYVFQVSDQSAYGKQQTAQEIFNFLVLQKSAWGFGKHTPNRKAIQPEDKVLFYVTGSKNQVFIATATLKSGAYEDKSGESKDWYLDPEALRIDLSDIVVFSEPKPRQNFQSLEWKPAQGGSSKISEHDYMVICGTEADSLSSTVVKGEEAEFVLEKYLEDFIVGNWDKIDFGEELTLFEDENGNKGQQYYTEEVGYIDILAKDKKGGYVVVELKKGRKNDEVVGQILRYIGWVRRNLAKNNEQVRGLVIVGERDTKLEHAVSEISDKVSVKLYKVSFRLEKY
jgi:restriction system protein